MMATLSRRTWHKRRVVLLMMITGFIVIIIVVMMMPRSVSRSVSLIRRTTRRRRGLNGLGGRFLASTASFSTRPCIFVSSNNGHQQHYRKDLKQSHVCCAGHFECAPIYDADIDLITFGGLVLADRYRNRSDAEERCCVFLGRLRSRRRNLTGAHVRPARPSFQGCSRSWPASESGALETLP